MGATSSRGWSPERGGQVLGLRRARRPGQSPREHGYWRDIGTLDAYYEAHMDLISVDPVFNLYNARLADPDAARAAAGGEVRASQEPGRTGHGARLDGLRRRDHLGRGRAPLGPLARRPRATRARWSRARCCMHGVDVGGGAIVRNAIVDKNVRIAPGAQIGVDAEADRERFLVSPRRDRRDRQGRRRSTPDLAGRAPHARVPARGLRRRGRPRRVPAARARPARRRDGALLGRRPRPSAPASRRSSRTGRGTRSPGAEPYAAALEAISIDLAMAAGVERRGPRAQPHVVREPRRPPGQAHARHPARRDRAQPRADAPVEGRAARRRLRASRASASGRRSRRADAMIAVSAEHARATSSPATRRSTRRGSR